MLDSFTLWIAVTEYVSFTSIGCSALFEGIVFKDMKVDFGSIKE